jgi:hypothetical protein
LKSLFALFAWAPFSFSFTQAKWWHAVYSSGGPNLSKKGERSMAATTELRTQYSNTMLQGLTQQNPGCA